MIHCCFNVIEVEDVARPSILNNKELSTLFFAN